jgi:hypothetical protein
MILTPGANDAQGGDVEVQMESSSALSNFDKLSLSNVPVRGGGVGRPTFLPCGAQHATTACSAKTPACFLLRLQSLFLLSDHSASCMAQNVRSRTRQAGSKLMWVHMVSVYVVSAIILYVSKEQGVAETVAN